MLPLSWFTLLVEVAISPGRTFLKFNFYLGKDGVSKTDEFSEKFQTAFDPPLIFGKSCCAFRDKIATKVRMFSMAGLLCII